MIRRMTGCLFALCLFHVPETAVFAQDTPELDSQGTLLWISDMHFDPFYDPDDSGNVNGLVNDAKDGWRDHTEWEAKFAKMPANAACSPSGKDANSFLVQQVLRQAGKVLSEKPDCILITGDFLSHDFASHYFSNKQLPTALKSAEQHNRFIDQTLAYLALSVSKAIPDVPVVAVLGNNDAYCGDYDIQSDSGFLANTRKTFQQYFLGDLSADFETHGGCYSTGIPGTNHKFIILNSIPFKAKYPERSRLDGMPLLQASCVQRTAVDFGDEYDWLKNTIDDCSESQKVWIACHIPPGVSCYDGTQNWSRPFPDNGGQVVPFVNAFQKYYLSQQDHFAGILAAHSHMAEFKLIPGADGNQPPASFVLMAPSIGRNHYNNASFRMMTFDRQTLAISDYTTHWLDGSQSPPTWGTPFSFANTYAQPNVSPQSLADVFAAMQSNRNTPSGKTTYLQQYFYDYSTRSNSPHGKPSTRFKKHYPQAMGSVLSP